MRNTIGAKWGDFCSQTSWTSEINLGISCGFVLFRLCFFMLCFIYCLQWHGSVSLISTCEFEYSLFPIRVVKFRFRNLEHYPFAKSLMLNIKNKRTHNDKNLTSEELNNPAWLNKYSTKAMSKQIRCFVSLSSITVTLSSELQLIR